MSWLSADAVCTVFGDPHYRTFDGKIYNFQGTCKYILAEDRTKDKSFSIKVRNDARQTTRFAWTQTVMIKYNKTKINLQQNGVIRVNRKVIQIPYTKAGSFVVHREGHSVVIELQNGMEIVWDGDSFLEVTVPSRYKGKLRGLCGNYNGIEADDFTGKDGISYLNAEEFGRTWRSGSKRACKIRPQVRSLESPCQSNFKVKLHAHKQCQVLTSALFLSCHRNVDVRSYYRYAFILYFLN